VIKILTSLAVTVLLSVALFLFLNMSSTEPALTETEKETLFLTPSFYIKNQPTNLYVKRESISDTHMADFLIDVKSSFNSDAFVWAIEVENAIPENSLNNRDAAAMIIGIYDEDRVDIDKIENLTYQTQNGFLIEISKWNTNSPRFAVKEIVLPEKNVYILIKPYYGLNNLNDFENLLGEIVYDQTTIGVLAEYSLDKPDEDSIPILVQEEIQKSKIQTTLQSSIYAFKKTASLYTKDSIQLGGGTAKLVRRNRNLLGFCKKLLETYSEKMSYDTSHMNCIESKKSVSVSLEFGDSIHVCLDSRGYNGIIRSEEIVTPYCI